MIKENMQLHLNDPTEKLFDLIITDFDVPNGSAVEILVTMQTLFQKANKFYPKVIMLTAIEDLGLKKAFFDEKLIHKFFNKPVSSDVLEEAILEIMAI
jgi:response regulator RpfG family c-di-GMP phosphodiesterase